MRKSDFALGVAPENSARFEEYRRPVLPTRVVGPQGFAVDAATGERIPDRLKAEATAVPVAPDGEDVCRQEFKQECDTSYQLKRFGAGQAFDRLRPLQGGEVNFDVDFFDAQQAVQPLREAYAKLPLKMRVEFPTLSSFVAGVESGKVKAAEAPAGSSGGAPAASPSDSAAVGAPKVAPEGDKPS